MKKKFRYIPHPHIIRKRDIAFGPSLTTPAPPSDCQCVLCSGGIRNTVAPVTMVRYECVICGKVVRDISIAAYDLLQQGLPIEEVFKWQE